MNGIAGAIMLGLGTLSLAVMYQGPNPGWLYLVGLGQLLGGLALVGVEWGPPLVRWLNAVTAIEVAPEERPLERKPE